MMVKICGITNREDAVAAIEAGASALGFNFYPGSPRYITPEKAAEIGDGLDVLKVGVFVDDPHTAEIAAIARIDIIQLHGNESSIPAGHRVWKAFRVTSQWSESEMDAHPAEAFLLDGPAPGCGEPFDWTRATGLNRKIILAGGLDAENVGIAIQQVKPWGVDACSRLESAPGIKDHEKVRRFIRVAMESI